MNDETIAPKEKEAYNNDEDKKQYVNVQYKDRVFRDLFGNPADKEAILSLYNAVNNTSYTNAEDIEVVTLNDAIYAKMKNDVAFMFSHELNLYEHQSTYNPNMPLRGLIYYAEECTRLYWKNNRQIYGKKRITIAAPRYYVFYNGTKDMPEMVPQKLSDSYKVPSDGYEWTAYVININAGKNAELMRKCQKLNWYSIFVSRIRENQKGGMSMEEAINKAIDSCINDDILSDYLSNNRERVISSLLCEYNEAEAMDYIREEGREEGHEEGRVEGHEEGREEKAIEDIKSIMKNFKISVQQAMNGLDIPEEKQSYYAAIIENM